MDDLISRQAAIDALMPIYKSASLRNRNVFSTARKCMAAIEELPSVQPEKRTEERTETHACENTCDFERKSNDMISRQDAVSRETDVTKLSMRIGDYLKRLSSASPKYTELSPDDVAFELSPGDMDGALAWYSTIMKLIQTGHVICRKESR